ncbi:MAG: hypothetical protein HQ464_05720 [Planctomycetes bacterium]|nr:hypothetical protein [Planctomycetota bacterium]
MTVNRFRTADCGGSIPGLPLNLGDACRSFPRMPVTLCLLMFLTATTALCASGFLLGLRVSHWQAPAALLVVSLSCFLGRGSLKRRGRALAAFLGVIGLALVASGLSVMYAIPDAEGYHRPAAQLIADGWNPVFDATHERLSKLLGPNPGLRLWHVAYLPRGLWIFSAAMYRVTGFVESGDAFNVVLLVICYQLMKTLLLRTTSLGPWGCKAVSLLVCISPVVPWQLLGGGNDAAFYFLFMICTCAATLFSMSGRWKWLVYLALALPLLVSLKFSGIIVALALGLVGTCALVLGPSSHRVQRLAHWWLALFHAGAIGAVIGFSPYVTNWVNHGGPFYPKNSFDKRVVAEDRITYDFQDMNDDARRMGWIGRFCSAYVSDTLAKEYYQRTVRPGFDPVIRVNGGVKGFGVVFRVAFLLSLVAMACFPMGWLRLPIAIILLTVAMQPWEYVGYARYVSQFYALPLLVLAGVLSRIRSKGLFRQRCPVVWKFLPTASLVLALVAYAIPLCIASCSWLALQWIVSVQNLDIVEAMQQDEEPQVFACTFYSRRSLERDSGVSGIRFLDLSHANRDQHGMYHVRDMPGYTACSSYFDMYTYFSPQALPDLPRLTHVLSKDDPEVKASRDRRNAEFFLREFLPKQVFRLPQYMWRLLRLRAAQFSRAWTRPHDAAQPAESSVRLAPAA